MKETKVLKREDYIYLRYSKDYKKNSKGDIIRYRKDYLIEKLGENRGGLSPSVVPILYEKNPNAAEDDIMFDKVYESITVTEDWTCYVSLKTNDYLYLGEWLLSHLDESDIEIINSIKKEFVDSNNSKLFKLTQENDWYKNCLAEIDIHLKKGEKLDFSTIDIASLFYDLEWLNIISHTEVITGEEKSKLFEEETKNAICITMWGHDNIYCYFKVKNNIEEKELYDKIYEMNIEDVYILKDENSSTTYIYTIADKYFSNRKLEQQILKIADRVSQSEALEINKIRCDEEKKIEEKRKEKWEKEIREQEEKEAQELEAQYQENKDNPKIFPGVNGNFVHNDNLPFLSKQKYSLKQIKEFYQNLKNLNPEIVKHICFYGGVIPYILNDASESRDFGDIDMFVPIEYMEELRKEFNNQQSFQMICDSRPYVKLCMLTTRISKETTEVALRDQSDNSNQAMLYSLINLLTPRDYQRNYMDEKGLVHNFLQNESNLPYYRKLQDFGFKAKLFGINISVFPIYEYQNDIMAKSFNITELHKFLLGVRVLNNTKIVDFIKKENINGLNFSILPLEYTLISKQSAMNGNYQFRYEKDKQDIEYILSHKDSLGISDDKIREIMSKYPDYSISIAYEIIGNRVETMCGETYKERILTNRNLS